MRAMSLKYGWVAGLILTSCAGPNVDLFGRSSPELDSTSIYMTELEVQDMEMVVENERTSPVDIVAVLPGGEVPLGGLEAGETVTWYLPIGALTGPVHLVARLSDDPAATEFQISEPFPVSAGEYSRWALGEGSAAPEDPSVVWIVSCMDDPGC